jgi:hypothetical protein
MPMGFPSWKGFLEELAERCGESQAVADLLTTNRFEEAAEKVEGALSPEIFFDQVRQTFGHRRSVACQLRGAVLALPELPTGPVVTTNFDHVLERAYIEAGLPFEHVLWGAQVDLLRRAITENKQFLFKVHGDAEERSGRVLTEREYDEHYAPHRQGDIGAQLESFFVSRVLLFVGCSLVQDRTMQLLSGALPRAPGMTHYAIVERPAKDEDLFARQKALGACGIRPIWYPSGDHHLIEPLLRWIAALQYSAYPSRRQIGFSPAP